MTTPVRMTAIVLLASCSALFAAPAPPPKLDATGYGERLPSNGGVTLWWCDSTWKVGRNRPAPEAAGEAVRLAAARNEFEAAQLVVRPEKALAGLSARATALAGPGGAAIPADAVRLLRARYLKVTAPTDGWGQAGDWPDPLPPFDAPLDVPAGANQPIWVLIRVPTSAATGDYEGRVELKAGDWSTTVPVRLHVWDFGLPDTPRTHSALGMGVGTIFQYHGLQSEADKRAVFDQYMQCFSEHRISPYTPTPFDPIEFKFLPDADPPRAEVDFRRFDAAMQQAIDRWHITSFNLPIPGMGGGTFHERHEGELAGHKAGTPKYEALFASAVKQVEAHLREKGWLDKAYVYWFDEPEPRDYAFVRAGMDRLKKHAPGIRRMLTEEPNDALVGAVDLWCPISDAFNAARAKPRQAAGEGFWWYVCTGPKSPYCTLFIDHPATSLRVWLWQTWQRDIDGILIWETTYWTSSAAFPDSLQNPYEDPMGYVSGYSTPRGEKKHWGNGDGRFVYPPESAAAGSKTPHLEPPVTSIRWEMIRDGIEDLDYLHILADRVRAAEGKAAPDALKQARALLEVPPEITADIKHYTFDPAPIYARRAAVARAIETLGR